MDTWTGDRALKDRFPLLFNTCSSQMASVAQVCGQPEYLRFRRLKDRFPQLFNTCPKWHLLLRSVASPSIYAFEDHWLIGSSSVRLLTILGWWMGRIALLGPGPLRILYSQFHVCQTCSRRNFGTFQGGLGGTGSSQN
jgi:hypothetical protein